VPGISVTSKLQVSPACDAKYTSPLGACIDAPAQQPHRQIIKELFDSIGIHLVPKTAADEEIPALVKAQKATSVTDVLQGVCYASNEAATHVCRECQDSVILQGKWMPYHFTPICRSLVKLMPGLRRKCFRCSSYYTVGTLDEDPVFDFRDLTSEPSSEWDHVFLWASEPRVYRKALVANDTPGTSPPGPERARLFDVTQAFITFFNPSILEKSLAPFMVQPEFLEDNPGTYSDLDALVKEEEEEEEPCIEASLGEESSPIIDLSED